MDAQERITLANALWTVGVSNSTRVVSNLPAELARRGYKLELAPYTPPTERAMIMVESSSEAGKLYRVSTMSDGTITCTCMSGKIRGYCKHQVRAVRA